MYYRILYDLYTKIVSLNLNEKANSTNNLSNVENIERAKSIIIIVLPVLMSLSLLYMLEAIEYVTTHVRLRYSISSLMFMRTLLL